jgi:hypothetical protein
MQHADELLERFEGLTFFPQPNEGFWRMGDVTYRDEIVIYRVLAKPGEFVILAYPAEYRNSGIVTFIVGRDGAVYQKDLGEKTGDVALAMTEFNPAEGWSQAMPHTGSASRAQK